MKKLIAMGLAVMMTALTVSGCGGSSTDSAEEGAKVWIRTSRSFWHPRMLLFRR